MSISFTQDVFMNTGLLVASELTNTPVSDLSARELAIVADRLEAIYTANDPEWKGYLASVIFNSPFQQARVKPETVHEHVELVLKSWEHDQLYTGEGKRCTYFPHLRAQEDGHRGMIPLLLGVGIGNFTPNGQGIPVSGLAMLMAHAMPLGIVRCGSLLFLLDEMTTGADPALAREFVRSNVEFNLSRKQGESLRNLSMGYESAVINTIWESKEIAHFVTGYFFSNFGNNASVHMRPINNVLMHQLIAMRQSPAWRAFAETKWRQANKTTINQLFDSMYEHTNYRFVINQYMRDEFLVFLEKNPELRSFDAMEIILKEM